MTEEHKFVAPQISLASRGEVLKSSAGIKFGGKQGLFVTNGYFSPQAKREYLSDYPSLTLDYLEGPDITSSVLSDPLLKALWFDGISIKVMTRGLSVPIICRDLSSDEPALICPTEDALKIGKLLEAKLNHRFKVTIEQDRFYPCESFEPYRAPERITTSEGFHGTVYATKVIVSGRLPYRIAPVVWEALSVLAEIHSQSQPELERFLAFRSGKPTLEQEQLCPSSLQLSLDPMTIISEPGEIWEESCWYRPSLEEWRVPRLWQAKIMEWIRLFNPTQNVCLRYELLGPPSLRFRQSDLFFRQHFRKYWEDSLFLLYSADALTQEEIDFVDPSFVLNTPFDKRLLVKEHPAIYDPLVSVPLGLMSDDPEDSEQWKLDFEREHSRASEWLIGLRKVLANVGEILSAEKARHLIAFLTNEDPLRGPAELVLHRTCDILGGGWNEIASPADPRARLLTIEAVWEVVDFHAIDWESIPASWEEQSLEFLLSFDSGYYDKRQYAKIELSDQCRTTEHINQRIRSLNSRAREVLMQIDAFFGDNAVLATEQYWNSEAHVYFD